MLDFGQSYRESGGTGRHTRSITRPALAKALLAVLEESLER
jgi:hypothetical protein